MAAILNSFLNSSVTRKFKFAIFSTFFPGCFLIGMVDNYLRCAGLNDFPFAGYPIIQKVSSPSDIKIKDKKLLYYSLKLR